MEHYPVLRDEIGTLSRKYTGAIVDVNFRTIMVFGLRFMSLIFTFDFNI